MSYLDFDVLLRKDADGYRAQVIGSPAGQASASFKLPFNELELENFLLRVGRPRRGTRRIGSPEMEAAKALGKRLFETLFHDDINACWRSSLAEAERRGAGLRLRLRLAETPELTDLPWKYLYNSPLNRFFSLSKETPLVRFLDLPEAVRPLRVSLPLNVLVVISSPSDFPALDVEREWERLRQALSALEGRGQLRLERLEDARLSLLQRKLRGNQYHILHFIGHGGFDVQGQDGVLVFKDESGRGRQIGAQTLGTILHDHRALRLVVLNACEGARGSRSDPFAGTAQSLVQQGIPAVMAMQFEITDEAAITLAEEFYSAMADGYPVEAALAEARRAIFAAGNDIEWDTPVLYLRALDGRIFDLPASSGDAAAAPARDRRAPAATPSAPPRPRAPEKTRPAAPRLNVRSDLMGLGLVAFLLIVFVVAAQRYFDETPSTPPPIPPSRGAQVQPGSQQDLVQTVGDRVFFDSNHDNLAPQNVALLTRLADWLKRYANVTVTVEGHIDDREAAEATAAALG